MPVPKNNFNKTQQIGRCVVINWRNVSSCLDKSVARQLTLIYGKTFLHMRDSRSNKSSNRIRRHEAALIIIRQRVHQRVRLSYHLRLSWTERLTSDNFLSLGELVWKWARCHNNVTRNTLCVIFFPFKSQPTRLAKNFTSYKPEYWPETKR